MKVYLFGKCDNSIKKTETIERYFLVENNLTIIIDANDGKGRKYVLSFSFVKEVSLFSVFLMAKFRQKKEIYLFSIAKEKSNCSLSRGFLYNNSKSQCNFAKRR